MILATKRNDSNRLRQGRRIDSIAYEANSIENSDSANEKTSVDDRRRDAKKIAISSTDRETFERFGRISSARRRRATRIGDESEFGE